MAFQVPQLEIKAHVINMHACMNTRTMWDRTMSVIIVQAKWDDPKLCPCFLQSDPHACSRALRARMPESLAATFRRPRSRSVEAHARGSFCRSLLSMPRCHPTSLRHMQHLE